MNETNTYKRVRGNYPMVVEVSKDSDKFVKIIMTKVEDVKDLEKRGRMLLKEEVMKQPENLRAYFKIEHLENDIPALNFMEKEGYILARGEAVREFFYEITPYGRKWALE